MFKRIKKSSLQTEGQTRICRSEVAEAIERSGDVVESLIGELDPDKRFCLICKKFKHKNNFITPTNYTSPLELMICGHCLSDHYRNDK